MDLVPLLFLEVRAVGALAFMLKVVLETREVNSVFSAFVIFWYQSNVTGAIIYAAAGSKLAEWLNGAKRGEDGAENS